MKLIKLSQQGMAHYVVPLVVIVLIAIGGVGYLVATHADPTTTSSSSLNWELLVSGTNRQTTASVYACLNEASSTQWWVKAKGELTPSVGDASKYTVGFALGNSHNGGGSSSNTWTQSGNSDVARFKGGFDPQSVPPSEETVTPSIQYPSSNPPVKGGGGGPVSVTDLVQC